MKICFWGNIAASLNGRTIGGAELQMALLARSLAGAGNEVVIIDPHISQSFVTPEGIHVLNVPEWNSGLPVIRNLTNRMPALYKALASQKADYYYIRMRSYFNLAAYRAARKTKGKVIVGLAHDLDVASFIKKFRYEYIYKFSLVKLLTQYIPNDLAFSYILKRADFITLQHEGQRIKSSSIKGKQAVFHNIFDFSLMPLTQSAPHDYFVIVGSLTPLKGAYNLLRIVNMIDKKNRIVVVGEPKGKQAEKIYKKLSKMSNVELKGRLPHQETLQLITNAKALINTSNYEGFPNIFLEAWAANVPVISLKINPGNVIDEYGLGVYCHGSFAEMKECIDSGKTEKLDKTQMSKYVRRFHEIGIASYNFLSILESAIMF